MRPVSAEYPDQFPGRVRFECSAITFLTATRLCEWEVGVASFEAVVQVEERRHHPIRSAATTTASSSSTATSSTSGLRIVEMVKVVLGAIVVDDLHGLRLGDAQPQQ